MRFEIPVLMRCCCCFPLRHGLLVWAYLKQIISLVFLIVMILKVIFERRVEVGGYVIYSLYILFIISDIVFDTLFIISAHKKDYRKMRIYYRYSIFVLGMYVVMIFLLVGLYLYFVSRSPFFLFMLSFVVGAVVTIMLMMCFQLYLIILVRSEFMKLKNNSQFEFVNHAADMTCTANIDFVKGIPETV